LFDQFSQQFADPIVLILIDKAGFEKADNPFFINDHEVGVILPVFDSDNLSMSTGAPQIYR
jgi:hypothetical protein